MGPPALVCVVILLALLAHARTLDSVHVNKCCKSSEVLDKYRRECQNSTVEDWTVKYLTMVPRKFRAGLPTNWKIREDARPPCDSVSSFFQRLHSFVAFENGSLFITEIGTLVPPASYCMDYDVVLVCNGESDTLIQQGERVNRCCGRNAVYSIDKRRCDYFKHDRTMSVPNGTVLVDSLPGCTDYALAGPYNESLVLANGSLKSTAFDTVLPSDSYCIEYLEESNDDVPSVLACTQYIVQSVKPKPTDFRFILYPIALSLSVIFLAATLIASFLMPASHHVLHWRCQTNYVLCLLLGDVVLCIVQFSGSGLADLGALCTILAFSMHFLFLSAFFWLNTMCFNIWWTFRDLRPQNLEKSQERCRLRLYVVYACGFPAIIALIGLILDLVGDETAFYQPGFGKHKCWFQGNMEIMLYFFIPVGILLAVNLALFVATARELTCGLWKRELVKSTTERAALGRVCLKLVIVMGVFWIADIISWIVGGPHEYWYSTDIFNCLQGVFIFIVVGCQPQVLAAVKRYWCWRRGSTVETAGTTNHHSSTSQGQPSMGETMCNHSVSNNTKSIALETSC